MDSTTLLDVLDDPDLPDVVAEINRELAMVPQLASTVAERDALIAELRKQLEEQPVPSTPVADLLGAVQLDAFRKSDDDWDNALDAALKEVERRRATSRITPPLLFPTAEIGLQRGGRYFFNGLKLIYPFGHGNQQRAAESIPCDVRFSGKGPLWKLPAGDIFDIGWEGIGWQGNAEADFIEASKANVWSSRFGSSGFNLWRHVLGNPAQQFNTTASVFEGWWNTNNCYNSPYTFGGSDSSHAWTRHIIDVGGAATASRFPANAYLMNFAHTSHAPVTGLYLTCEGAVTGVRVSNSTTGGRVVLSNPIIEGRNPDRFCTSTLLQVDSGIAIVENPVLEFVKKDQAREAGAGVVINGGDVELIRPTFDRARGVDPAVPVVYQRGGVLNIQRAKRTERGGSWGLQRPVVKRSDGTCSIDGTTVLAA